MYPAGATLLVAASVFPSQDRDSMPRALHRVTRLKNINPLQNKDLNELATYCSIISLVFLTMQETPRNELFRIKRLIFLNMEHYFTKHSFAVVDHHWDRYCGRMERGHHFRCRMTGGLEEVGDQSHDVICYQQTNRITSLPRMPRFVGLWPLTTSHSPPATAFL